MCNEYDTNYSCFMYLCVVCVNDVFSQTLFYVSIHLISQSRRFMLLHEDFFIEQAFQLNNSFNGHNAVYITVVNRRHTERLLYWKEHNND